MGVNRMCTDNLGRHERLFAYLLIVFSLIAFYVMNWLTPIQRDDWSYSFNFVSKMRISSFTDIFQSLGRHYERVNGRLPVHFFAHLFLWLGKDVFNFINTVAYAVLITLIYFHAFGTLRNFHPYLWLVIFAGLWLLTPAFGDDYLWVTGASNYLYGMLMILLYFIPFRRSFESMNPPNKFWYTPFAFLGGVFAGWTNENTGGALAVMLICLLGWRFIEKKRIPFWWWSGLAGVFIGVALLVLAPGELLRLNIAGGMGGLHTIIGRVVSITKKLLRFFWPGIAFWVFQLVIFFTNKRDLRLLCFPLIVLLTGLAATYSMALSPWMPNRTWCGPLVFFLISAVSIWQAAGKPHIQKPYLRLVLVSICAVCLLGHFSFIVPKLAATKAAFDIRERNAADQLARGEHDLVLDSVCGSGSRFDVAGSDGDISTDANYWLNIQFARYLGANTVVAKER